MASTDVLSGVFYKRCSLELKHPLQAWHVCLWCTNCRYLIIPTQPPFRNLLLLCNRQDSSHVIWHLSFSVYSHLRVHKQPIHEQTFLARVSSAFLCKHDSLAPSAATHSLTRWPVIARGLNRLLSEQERFVCICTVEWKQYSACLDLFLDTEIGSSTYQRQANP